MALWLCDCHDFVGWLKRNMWIYGLLAFGTHG